MSDNTINIDDKEALLWYNLGKVRREGRETPDGGNMADFIDYLEAAFDGEKDDGTLYRFKRQTLEKMNERADEITHSGLRDDKVLYDRRGQV